MTNTIASALVRGAETILRKVFAESKSKGECITYRTLLFRRANLLVGALAVLFTASVNAANSPEKSVSRSYLEKLSPELRLAVITGTDFVSYSSSDHGLFIYYRINLIDKHNNLGRVVNKFKESKLVSVLLINSSCFEGNGDCILTVQLK